MELYRITFRGQVYAYCSGTTPVEYGLYTYVPSPINRTEISLELNDSEVRLTIPLDTEPFGVFVTSSPSADMSITIIDYDTLYELFNGILTKITFYRSKGTAEAVFKRKEAFFDSEVPYRTYGTTCSFVLFSSECGVSSGNYIHTSTNFTISQDKKTITIPSIVGTGRNYTGGVLTTDSGDSCFIVLHSATTVILDSPVYTVPTVVSVNMGCDKTFGTCGSTFSNSINFGGFPFIPAKNPVTESI